jgi:hypothetical protein
MATQLFKDKELFTGFSRSPPAMNASGVPLVPARANESGIRFTTDPALNPVPGPSIKREPGPAPPHAADREEQTSKKNPKIPLPVIHVLTWSDLEHFDYPVGIVQIENDPVIPDALVKIGISFTAFHIPVRIFSDGFYLIDNTGSMDF